MEPESYHAYKSETHKQWKHRLLCNFILLQRDNCCGPYKLNIVFFPHSFPPCVRRWGSESWTGEVLPIYCFVLAYQTIDLKRFAVYVFNLEQGHYFLSPTNIYLILCDVLWLPHSRDRASHNDVIGTTHVCMSKISAPGGEIDGK